MKYVISVGSMYAGGVSSGVCLVGPFDSFGDAERYIEQQKYETYEVVELEEPQWDYEEDDKR